MLSLSWNIDAVIKVVEQILFQLSSLIWISSINLRKIKIINNIDGGVEFGTASYTKLFLIFKRYLWLLSTSWWEGP